MKHSQIATLLNNTIVPNIFGGDSNGYTIAEDLSNIVDLGTKIADMDADTLKNFAKDLAVGVYDTYVDTRTFETSTYGLFISEVEYGGALQRVKAKLLSASDSNMLTLVPASNSGPDYTDGKFYGTDWDARVYTDSVGFKVKCSISYEMFKQSFTSASGVSKLIAMIEANLDTTIKVELNGMARSVLRKLILNAYQGSRKIQLMTLYNSTMGYTSSDPGYVTLATWKNDERFKVWCQTCILELRKYIQDINEKYGNGDVYTFTPEEDTRCVLLTEFAAEMDVALSSVYHKELVDGLGKYETINYWQNGSEDLLPQMASGSVHDEIKEITDATTTPATVTTISHVVGVVFDRWSAFITNKVDMVTVKNVEEESFYTMFHHIHKQYAVDPRNTGIVLLMA